MPLAMITSLLPAFSFRNPVSLQSLESWAWADVVQVAKVGSKAKNNTAATVGSKVVQFDTDVLVRFEFCWRVLCH